MPVARMPEPQNFMRPSENAASTLTTMVMTTTQTVTIAVFLKKIRKSLWVNSSLNWSKVMPLAMIHGIGRHMRDFGVALERRDHHVIGRHQEEDREDDQEEIGRDQRPAPVALQAGPLEKAAASRARCMWLSRHPISLPRLRTPRRMKTAAIARIGSMNSEIAEPSGRSPERMPSRNE